MAIPFQDDLPTIPSSAVELRVHGVSGTPPTAMLKSYPLQFWGSKRQGMFRRLEGGRDRAYWWGGLTSGSWVQALWLLLFPFALLNVGARLTPSSEVLSRSRWSGTKEETLEPNPAGRIVA